MQLHRELTSEEEKDFKAWARQNYKPYETIYCIWHPVVQAECVLMNKEAEADSVYCKAHDC